ncbi:MAG: TrkA family potassium uptake protein [Actinobacteria bacterium]|nr:TrkA family potassium uptake protein [Actinomycetota bacterium]MBU2687729.1 TrkA family potassium uptake protein [Actinomycetota bacterium]
MVGSFLAAELHEKGHTVVVIEKDTIACDRLSAKVPVMVICGDACDYRYQEEARVDRADVFAAVTGDDDDNLVACQLAKTSFDVPRTVARVNNPKNERIFNLMGVDAISGTTIIGHLIEKETTLGEIITLQVMRQGRFAMVEVDLPESGCRCCGKAVQDLDLPRDCVLVAIIRGDETVIPSGTDSIQAGDSVIAVTSMESEDRLRKVLLG